MSIPQNFFNQNTTFCDLDIFQQVTSIIDTNRNFY